MENARIGHSWRTGVPAVLALLLLLLPAATAAAEQDNAATQPPRYGFQLDPNRWIKYATNVHKGVFFYDVRSVTPKGEKVKVWIKSGDPVNGSSEYHKFREVTVLKELDCGTRTMRDLEWTAVKLSGTKEKSVGASDWQNIQPETSDEVLFAEVCKRTQKGKKK